MKENLLKIINHYGLMKQLKYIHSEYFELDEAILNYQSSGFDFNYDEEAKDIEKEYKNHIVGEIADIMVMLRQIQYYYGIPDEDVEAVMNYKIGRQLDRIKGEKNNEIK